MPLSNCAVINNIQCLGTWDSSQKASRVLALPLPPICSGRHFLSHKHLQNVCLYPCAWLFWSLSPSVQPRYCLSYNVAALNPSFFECALVFICSLSHSLTYSRKLCSTLMTNKCIVARTFVAKNLFQQMCLWKFMAWQICCQIFVCFCCNRFKWLLFQNLYLHLRCQGLPRLWLLLY